VISPDAPPYKGGISRLVGILYNGLERRGHNVTLMCPKYRIREFKFSTIPFHRYGKFDIMHLHGPTPFLSDLTLMINNKRPIFYTHHAEISWFSERISNISSFMRLCFLIHWWKCYCNSYALLIQNQENR